MGLKLAAVSYLQSRSSVSFNFFNIFLAAHSATTSDGAVFRSARSMKPIILLQRRRAHRPQRHPSHSRAAEDFHGGSTALPDVDRIVRQEKTV